MTSVRLNDDLERLLDRTARRSGKTKSQIVRESIELYCCKHQTRSGPSPYELIRDRLGAAASGRGDLSVRGREIILEALRGRRPRRTR